MLITVATASREAAYYRGPDWGNYGGLNPAIALHWLQEISTPHLNNGSQSQPLPLTSHSNWQQESNPSAKQKIE